jgi:hypothetical protein
MAESTKLITIDANGDTILTLKDIHWKLPAWETSVDELKEKNDFLMDGNKR